MRSSKLPIIELCQKLSRTRPLEFSFNGQDLSWVSENMGEEPTWLSVYNEKAHGLLFQRRVEDLFESLGWLCHVRGERDYDGCLFYVFEAYPEMSDQAVRWGIGKTREESALRTLYVHLCQ